MFAFGLVALLLLAGCAQEAPQEPEAPEAPTEPEQPEAPTEPEEPDEPMPGSDRDEHGCIPSAGYEWCEPLQKCIRPWEENCTEVVGGDKDEHGCIPSAGYVWCEPKQKCLRTWEEPCVHLDEGQAREIAMNSDCISVGPIHGPGTYNNNTYTWWFDLISSEKPDCSPACVVYEGNESAEVNWRCTGLVE